jgi:hypothetical protein
MVRRRSEAPTVPPPFNVDRYAKDSDARVAAVHGSVEPASEPAVEERAASERRLISRPKIAAATDEAWACGRSGALTTVVSVDTLKGMPLDHRAGYLLSWMDGSIDLETLIEVSTLPRDQVLRIVRDLFESGIVAFR